MKYEMGIIRAMASLVIFILLDLATQAATDVYLKL